MQPCWAATPVLHLPGSSTNAPQHPAAPSVICPLGSPEGMCTSGLCDTCLHIHSDKFYNFNCVSLLAPLHTTAKFSSTSYREPNRWLQLHLLLASSTSSSGSLGGGLLQFPQKANSLSGGHTLTAMDSGWSVHMESHEIWVSKFTGKSVMGFNSIRILNPIRIFIFIFLFILLSTMEN